MTVVAPLPAMYRIWDNAGRYYRKHPQGILVLRAFRKKTEKTPQSEILLARRRLKEMLDDSA